MEAEQPLRLLVALAMSRPLADPGAAVEALRVGIEDVVLPATFVDFDWHTSVITPADDLERGMGLTAPSRDWDLLRAAAAELESGGVGAHRQDVPRDLLPPEPTADPISATARLPADQPALLAWSVHRWAVRDWSSFCRAATRWLLETGERLGADSGFVTYDVLDAVQPLSAWDIVTQVSPAERDLGRFVWGYGWGTFLSASLAEAVGGPAALGGVPGASVLIGPGGHVWVRLGDDPAAVERSAVAALRAVLAPVLPVGRRTVEEYQAPPDHPFEVRPAYVV